MHIHRYRFSQMTDKVQPMMQHNPASMTVSAQGQLDVKKIPEPKVEAEAGRYLNEKGNFRFPAQGPKSSIVAGAVGRRVGKRAASAFLKAGMFPTNDWVDLLDIKTEKPIPGAHYELDMRRVLLNGKIGIIRSRPLVRNWCFYIDFEMDDLLDDPKMVETVGNMAGRMVGIGDFRPQKGGPFGRYRVELIQ